MDSTTLQTFLGAENYMRSQGIQVNVLQDTACIQMGSHVARDSLVSVMYSTKLNSTTSSVIPQRTDRHEILGQKPSDFQRLS